MFFSVIIPVYNRPKEILDLLQSLSHQSFNDFEVLIIEDGSVLNCRKEVDAFKEVLNIKYFFIQNVGQGFARNYGIEKAKGSYFIFFDSDCIIPENYLRTLKKSISERKLDAHGGPDAASDDFSSAQKAMDFAMTSWLTTGGIRGKMKDPSKYQARGFNMGFSRKVFEKVGGFADPNKAEDIEISIRIKKAGFKLELVSDAFVYHKRKNDFKSFIKQGFSFGRNRVNVSRFHSDAIKLVHFMPFLFLLFLFSMLFTFWLIPELFGFQALILAIWSLSIFAMASIQYGQVSIGSLALVFSIFQLTAYGLGLAYELSIKWLKG
ncbi:glycosyltransferase [Mongoliibacter ruber]|uniref:GT2 family glycosyltransferase n=1 Tax=Mongoliibacter ruber TaxID=1750599 RepID=A0A2T0WJC9_9BACT|nr:glycosyltransferase [Mongoliibacter ruber]PRY86762.1 GT2 family glycosyltransferase [Mongoliibacter ruber]